MITEQRVFIVDGIDEPFETMEEAERAQTERDARAAAERFIAWRQPYKSGKFDKTFVDVLVDWELHKAGLMEVPEPDQGNNQIAEKEG